MDQMGWRPVDVARAVGLSKASVSLFLSGKGTPGERTLDLFRRIVAERLAQQGKHAADSRQFPPVEAYVIEDSARKDAMAKLGAMAKTNPRAFESISLIIDSFTAQPRASSAEAVALGEPSELDVAGVPHPPATFLPKRAAPVPSAHTAPPAAPAPPRRGGRPAAPKPAPTAPES